MQPGQIRRDVEPRLGEFGLLVEDVTVTRAGRRSLVRVAVDRDLDRLETGASDDDPDSPIPPVSLDEIADATRAVSSALDADPQLGSSPYVLEVTSPGVERPLTEWRQLRRNVGRLAQLRLADGSSVQGRIVAVRRLDLDVQLTDSGRHHEPAVRTIPVADVSTGQVIVEFGRSEPSGPAGTAEGEEL